jgi:hypothetical protein
MTKISFWFFFFASRFVSAVLPAGAQASYGSQIFFLVLFLLSVALCTYLFIRAREQCRFRGRCGLPVRAVA